MPQREHTSTQYEQQLRALKNKLLLMSNKAEQMISDSIRSLVERRPSLAEAVIARDDEIDKREIEGDERYDAMQAFLAMCARLAREGRLSRFAYLARKSMSAA